MNNKPQSSKKHYPVAVGAHPRGSVLMFTLLLMMLMTLVGTALLVGSKTELSISQNTKMGRDAFNRADMATRITVPLTRATLQTVFGEGAAHDLIKNTDGYSISVNDSTFTSYNMTSIDYTAAQRYLKAGTSYRDAVGGIQVADLVFFEKDASSGKNLVIASAAVSKDLGLAEVENDLSDPAIVSQMFIITVNGRQPADNLKDELGGSEAAPRTIINVLMKEVFSN